MNKTCFCNQILNSNFRICRLVFRNGITILWKLCYFHISILLFQFRFLLLYAKFGNLCSKVWYFPIQLKDGFREVTLPQVPISMPLVLRVSPLVYPEPETECFLLRVMVQPRMNRGECTFHSCPLFWEPFHCRSSEYRYFLSQSSKHGKLWKMSHLLAKKVFGSKMAQQRKGWNYQRSGSNIVIASIVQSISAWVWRSKDSGFEPTYRLVFSCRSMQPLIQMLSGVKWTIIIKHVYFSGRTRQVILHFFLIHLLLWHFICELLKL